MYPTDGLFPPDPAGEAITLHLGAHRTGSTRAQNQIRRWRRQGRLDDVDVFAPQRLRRMSERLGRTVDLAPAAGRFAFPALLRLLSPPLARALALARDGGPHVLISDEVLLGNVDRSVLDDRGLYAEAPRRLAALQRLIGARPMRVILGVRDYAAWLPSAYALILRRRALPPPDALAARWARLPRGWTDVVRDVVDAFGNCEIAPYEAAARDPSLLPGLLLGRDVRSLPADDRRSMRSLSAAAVEAIAAGRAEGRSYDAAALDAIAAAETDSPPLRPFAPDVAARLTERYLSDLQAMAAIGARVWALDESGRLAPDPEARRFADAYVRAPARA